MYAEEDCVHMCAECGQTFSTSNALDEHMKVHPDELSSLRHKPGFPTSQEEMVSSHTPHSLQIQIPILYLCIGCNKKFSDLTVLKQHSLTECDKEHLKKNLEKQVLPKWSQKTHNFLVSNIEKKSCSRNQTMGRNESRSAQKTQNIQAIEILDSDEEAELREISHRNNSLYTTGSFASHVQPPEDPPTFNLSGKHGVIPHSQVNNGDVLSLQPGEQPQPNGVNVSLSPSLGEAQSNSSKETLLPSTLGQAQPLDNDELYIMWDDVNKVWSTITVGPPQPRSRNVLLEQKLGQSQPDNTTVVFPQSSGQPQRHCMNVLSLQTQPKSTSKDKHGLQTLGHHEQSSTKVVFPLMSGQPQSNVLTVDPFRLPQGNSDNKTLDQPLPSISDVLSVLFKSQPQLKYSIDYVLKCPMCDLILVAATDLQQHLFQNHVVDTSRHCLLCKQDFLKKSEKTLHMYTEHNTHSDFVCPICTSVLSDEFTLWEHIFTHSVKVSVEHTDTTESTASTDKLVDKVHFCGECGNGFKHARNLVQHMKSHQKHTCKLCSKIFRWPFLLQRHMKTHTKPVQKTPEENISECSNAFGTDGEVHVRRKIDTENPVCLSCSDKCNCPLHDYKDTTVEQECGSDLLGAQELSGQLKKSSTCGMFPLTSGQPPSNNPNVLTVAPLEPLQENSDNIQTVKSLGQPLPNVNDVLSLLTRNQPQLRESMDYVLKCPMCDVIFTEATDLQQHIFQNHVVDTSQCLLCKQDFLRKSEKALHMYTEHNTHSDLVCPICTSVLSDESTLLEHISTHSVKVSVEHRDTSENTAFHQRLDVKLQSSNESVPLTYQTNPQKQLHLKSHQMHACPLCPDEFENLSLLQKHLNIHIKPKQMTPEQKVCPEWGNKSTSGVVHVCRKKDIQEPVRPLSPEKCNCPQQEYKDTIVKQECGSNFPRGQILDDCRKNIPGKPAVYPIKLESVTWVTDRTTDIAKTSRKESPYSTCIKCVHGFTLLNDLQDHLDMHQCKCKC